jgi:hypothetical protein
VSYRIPRDPSWCSRCIREGVCEDHRGPDGSPQPYAGPDAYEPTSWVLEVVGGRYRSHRGVDVCTGYDPREGFWMQSAVDASNRTNVSERAIGRTFHQVDLIPGGGAQRMLVALAGGQACTPEWAAERCVDLDLATARLRDLGFLDGEALTAAGRAAGEAATAEGAGK